MCIQFVCLFYAKFSFQIYGVIVGKMNRAIDFYSKPSSMSAYPIYNRHIINQRGGIFDPNPQRTQKALNTIAPLLFGITGLAQGIKQSDNYM